MKLREPEMEPPQVPDWDRTTKSEDGSLHRMELEVTLVTPMYGGGVTAGEVDTEMPVRTSAIRGQLRFWWRLLNRSRYRSEPELFVAERDLWGGMAGDGESYTSKVRLAINDVGVPDLAPCATYRSNPNRPGKLSGPDFHPSVDAYALFPGSGELNEARTEITKEPAVVALPGLEFTLVVKTHASSTGEVQQALRWWGSFGGLGARTRRGLGSVHVAGLDPVSREEAEASGCRMVALGPSQSAVKAWKSAIDKLRTFRQGEGVGRNKGGDPKRPGRSRWPEPESIRRITGEHRVKADGTSFQPDPSGRIAFPRAMFGLPIVFHFQNERGDVAKDPKDCELRPRLPDGDQPGERMASPLILKAMALPDGRFAPAALLLPEPRLDGMPLVLVNSKAEQGNRNLPTTLEAGEWWPAEAESREALGRSIEPLRNRDPADPLVAFLHFFEKG